MRTNKRKGVRTEQECLTGQDMVMPCLLAHKNSRTGKFRMVRFMLFCFCMLLAIVAGGLFMRPVMQNAVGRNEVVTADAAGGTNAAQWEAAIAAGTGTVKLDADWTAPFGTSLTNAKGYTTTGALFVASGKNITLDLNGHKINRGLTAATDGGLVISVWGGTLTVIDSAGGGQITGGYNSRNYTTSSSYYQYIAAGGVLVYSGTFNLQGGTITGNRATGATSAGGVFVNSGTFNMTGGSITGNFVTTGNTNIATNATASGGVYWYGGNFRVGGSAQITGNTRNTSAIVSNVSSSNQTWSIGVTSAFTSTAKIGFTRVTNNYVNSNGVGSTTGLKFTSGFSTYNSGKNPTDVFFADLSKSYRVINNGGDAAMWCINPALNWNNAYNAGGTQKITLYDNWVTTVNGAMCYYDGYTGGGMSNNRLLVDGGRNITVDLNGYTMNRNKNAEDANGQHFYVNSGTLTIQDSSAAKTGKITGGWGTTVGGAIRLQSGTLNLTGGSITGNRGSAGYAGGIYYNNGSVLNISGTASVYNNYGGTGTVQGNIYMTNAAQVINVTGALSSTSKFGILRVRGSNGVSGAGLGNVTNGFARNNSGQSATDYFSFDYDAAYYVVNSEDIYREGKAVSSFTTANEAFVMTTNNAVRWTYFVDKSSASAPQTMKLDSDWKATTLGTATHFVNGALQIPSGKNIILDLNGHTISRNLTAATDGGVLIKVNGGTFTLKDSVGGGVLTGGFNSRTYTTNTSYIPSAGGVLLWSGTFNMQGGTISGNKFSNNIGAGGVFINSGTFNMTGGTITSNQATVAATTMTAVGGVYNYGGTFNVSGNARVTGNTHAGVRGNIATQNASATINVTGKLDTSASFGFTRIVNNYSTTNGSPITINYAKNNTDSVTNHFFADDSTNYRVISNLSGSGEAALWCINNSKNWIEACASSAGASGALRHLDLYSNWTGNGASTSSLNLYDSSTTYFYNGALYVIANVNIELNLNGYTIDRNQKTNIDHGYVIRLYNGGKLTIQDTSANKSGKITGGNSNNYAGGIWVQSNNCVLTMNGGNITGNIGASGGAGGVYMQGTSRLNIGGDARIQGNKSKSGADGNIQFNTASNLIYITSKLNIGQKFGVMRAILGDSTNTGLGVFTSGFGKFHPTEQATDYFTSDYSRFYVVHRGTGAASEGYFMSRDNIYNWSYYVGISSTAAPQTVVLESTWNASGGSFGTLATGFYNGALCVPAGKSIVLDLNGFTINRGLTAAMRYGMVFYIQGSLTIIDSSAAKSGTIKGGFNQDSHDTYGRAGGIHINAGTVIMQGGTITGNRSAGTTSAGGVTIVGGGTFKMTGGTITGNSVTASATRYADSITVAGGVYNFNGYFQLGGSAKITGNTRGNGAYVSNVANAVGTAITNTINIVEPFTSDAKIGLTRTVNNYSTTSGSQYTANYAKHNSDSVTAHFFADDADNYRVISMLNGSGEAALWCINNAKNWNDAYNSCYSTSGNPLRKLELYSNWTGNLQTQFGYTAAAGFESGRLYLPNNIKLEIDLMGYTISRGLTAATANGQVIYINGSGQLTIRDNSVAKSGKITGGYNNAANGGGILLNSNASILYLYGGTVTGNKATGSVGSCGGGIYVNGTAQLHLGGSVKVTGNTTNANAACNIFIQTATNNLYVDSALTGGEKFGITRLGNGPFTVNYGKNNPSIAAKTYFVSEHSSYYIINSNDNDGSKSEGYIMSTNNAINWSYFVGISSTASPQTVVLASNWNASGGSFGSGTGYISGALNVPAGKSIILDLAGFTIDRKLTAGQNTGCVFWISGTLVITDSSTAKTGTIKGGFNSSGSTTYSRAGGIYIDGGGIVTLRAGTITGNQGTGGNNGGGVGIYQGVFNMTGGTITGNKGYAAGGVWMNNTSGSAVNVGGSAKIEGNLSTTNAKSDVLFENQSAKFGFVSGSRFTSGAHIGFSRSVNNYNFESTNGSIFTNGYTAAGNTADPSRYFFISDSNHRVQSYTTGGKTEATVWCINNATNWVNCLAAAYANTSARKTFTLYSDWDAAADSSFVRAFGTNTTYYRNGALYVNSNAHILFDLNGYTLNRKLTSETANGYVLWINGSGDVQMVDSSAAKTGTITGGYNNANGGCVWLNSSGSIFQMTGGTITGNKAPAGAGVWVNNTGSIFRIGGNAVITGNTTKANVPANIYLNATVDTLRIYIISKLTGGQTFGVTRPANGPFTSSFGSWNKTAPVDVFTSENNKYYVINGSDTVTEGFFMSSDNATNWSYFVQLSVTSKKQQTVTLASNWTATAGTPSTFMTSTATYGYYEGALCLPSGSNIILDLNGFTINRNQTASTNHRSGGVFLIQNGGRLTIIDSKGGGKITGGYSSNSNTSYVSSGGIYVASGGYLEMQAGTITGNYATNNTIGAGVTVDGTFKMTGGTITGNVATNTNITLAGGVYVRNSGAFQIGGDVHINGNLRTRGSSRVESNVATQNVTYKLNVIDTFASGAKIGFSRAPINNFLGETSDNSVFTVNYGTHNPSTQPSTVFFADDDESYRVQRSSASGFNQQARLFCIDNALNWHYASERSAATGVMQTFTLYKDWTAQPNNTGFYQSTATESNTGISSEYFYQGALYIRSNRKIKIDLNGYTLDRGLKNVSAGLTYGYAIFMNAGELEIVDSSVAQTGKITGAANATANQGGAIHSNTNANKITITSGTITGNRTTTAGAGVFVAGTNVQLNLGAKAKIEGNTLLNGKTASNIYLNNEASKINIVSALQKGNKFGVARAGSGGVFTTNFAKFHTTSQPSDYFVAENAAYNVINDESGEGLLLSSNPQDNWQYAVKTSVSTKKQQICKLTQPFTARVNGSSTTFYPASNVTYANAYYQGALFVPSGANVVLDLNGQTVDRALKSVSTYGYIFYIQGTLTIRDSSADQSGVIKGGWNNTTNNYCRAGAIHVYSGGTLNIEGGTITGSKGIGSNNAAIYINSGTFTMTGGAITGNVGVLAGGVYVQSGTVSFGGSAKIYDNTLNGNGRKNDVNFADSNARAYVISKFEDDAHIGIVRATQNNYTIPLGGLFTRNYGQYNPDKDPAEYFFASDSDNFRVQNYGTTSGINAEGAIWCINNTKNWYEACAQSVNSGVIQTVTLYKDWIPAQNSATGFSKDDYYTYGNATNNSGYYWYGALHVIGGVKIRLDLNGFNLNRNLTSAQNNGMVVRIYSSGLLEVVDSSATHGGKITGGFNASANSASGILISSAQSSFRIESGVITGNKGGAGVYVNGTGKFYLGNSAQIDGNTASNGKPSNIYLQNATNVINIVSALTNSTKYGVTRIGNGPFTKNYGVFNAAAASPDPTSMFESENENYKVISEGAGTAIEGVFLSTEGSVNWQYVVSQSLSHNGAEYKMQLSKDWSPTLANHYFGTGTGYYNGILYVPRGATVTLDLNGYTIDRAIGATAITYGSIFRIEGVLKIIDSSAEGTGIITGGNNNTTNANYTRAGFAYITNGGSLTLEGGTVKGNIGAGSNNAGGVYLMSGSFKMTGGSLIDNTGLYAGGVYAYSDSKVYVEGDAVIEDNIRRNARNNFLANGENNVEFSNTNGVINVTGPMKDGAHIGITKIASNVAAGTGAVFTNGFGRYNSDTADTDDNPKAETYFFSDVPTDCEVTTTDAYAAKEGKLLSKNNVLNWVNAINTSLNTGTWQTVKLYSDWIAEDSVGYTSFGIKAGFSNVAANNYSNHFRYGSLYVPNGAKIILDLNGFKIDRNLVNKGIQYNNGYVFHIRGAFEVIDSSDQYDNNGKLIQAGTGVITGGNYTNNGLYGGIWVYSGSLTLNGGTVTGNKNGYGVYVNTSSQLNIGKTAQVHGNELTGGLSGNVYFANKTGVINVTSELLGTYPIGITRNENGNVTSGWGKNNIGAGSTSMKDGSPINDFDEYVLEYFSIDNRSEYRIVCAEDDDDKREAVILHNDNPSNWVYAVTTSLSTRRQQTFTMVGNWQAVNNDGSTFVKKYGSYFGSVDSSYKTGGLYVPAGANVVLNLNGFHLDRNYSASGNASYGFNIYVEGTLTIVDNVKTDGGADAKILGGLYGVQVGGNGVVNMQSGTIQSNYQYGVNVQSGTFNMTGGTVTGNNHSSRTNTADVYVTQQGKIGLGGTAKIEKGSADNHGLWLSYALTEINMLSKFESGASVSLFRESVGNLTTNWENTADATKSNYPDVDATAIFKSEDSRFKVEVLEDGDTNKHEVFLTSEDPNLNWQYIVTKSLAKGGKYYSMKLYRDWNAAAHNTLTTAFGTTSAYINGALYVPKGANVGLDLNGYTLNRGLTAATERGAGYNMYVEGTVRVFDETSQYDTDGNLTALGKGTVTGGYGNGGNSAGGIHIYNTGNVTLEGITLSGNFNSAGSASAGAVYASGALTMNNCTVSDNSGGSTGGIYSAGSAAVVELNNCTFADNVCTAAGGGALYTGGKVTMNGGVIENSVGTAGAVYIPNGGEFILKDGHIKKNTGTGVGGVFVSSSTTAKFTMEGGEIFENTGAQAGGLYVAGTVEMTGGAIHNNVATGEAPGDGANGGGVYLAGTGKMTMTGGSVSENTGDNGLRVFTSGVLTLGGSAQVFHNYTSAEKTQECNIMLSAASNTIRITKFDVPAEGASPMIGVYQDHAGVFTSGYGENNGYVSSVDDVNPMPHTIFYSDLTKYAVALNEPEDGSMPEALIGTPIDIPALVDPIPVYDGNEHSLIKVFVDEDGKRDGFNPLTMEYDLSLAGDDIRYENGEFLATHAGKYLIKIKPKEEYCWRTGSVSAKIIEGEILKKAVHIVWLPNTEVDSSETDYYGKFSWMYDGAPHAPKAMVDENSLVDADKSLTIEVTVSAGETQATQDSNSPYIAKIIGIDSTDYFVDESEADTDKCYQQEYTIGRAPFEFSIEDETCEYKTAFVPKLKDYKGDGAISYAVKPGDTTGTDKRQGNGEVKTDDSGKEYIWATARGLIEVTVNVAQGTNYLASTTTKTIEVLPAPAPIVLKETTVAYGDKIVLTLNPYDADTNEGGVIKELKAYDNGSLVNNEDGMAIVKVLYNDDGTVSYELTGRKVGKVSVWVVGEATDNYRENDAEIEIEVVPREVELEWVLDAEGWTENDDGSCSYVYDGESHAPQVKVKDSFLVKWDGITPDKVTVNLTADSEKTNSNEGGTAYVATVEGLSNANYKLKDGATYTQNFFILRADPDLKVVPEKATYKNKEEIKIDWANSTGEETTGVTFKLTKDTDAEGNKLAVITEEEGGKYMLDPLHIGTITVEVTVPATENYNGKTFTVDIEIEKIERTITRDDMEVTLGDQLPLTVECNGTEEPGAITFRFGSIFDENYADILLQDGNYILDTLHAGTVAVVVEVAETDNYKAATLTFNVVIKPRPLKFIWDDERTFEYNAQEHYPYVEVDGTSIVTGILADDIVLTYDGIAIDAGKHTLTVTGFTYDGVALSDYVIDETLSNASCEYEITPYVVTLVWKAPSTTFVYNGLEQKPTATVAFTYTRDGKAEECEVEVLGTANAGDNLSATAISLSNSNYTLVGCTNTMYTYRILPKQIGITWSDFLFEYDGLEHAPTATATGLIAGDTCNIKVLGAQTNALLASDPDYVAEAYELDNSNYTLDGLTAAQKQAKFRIKMSNIKLEITTLEAIYGTPLTLAVNATLKDGTPVTLPAGVVVFTLKSGSTIATLTGAVLLGTDIGTVTVMASVPDSVNYSGDSVTAEITIKPRPVTVTWTDTAFVYDGAQHRPVPTITNLYLDDDCGMTLTDPNTNAGNYTAVVRALDNNKYTLVDATGIEQDYVISPRIIIVQWGKATEDDSADNSADFLLIYNGTVQHPEVRILNLVDGDACDMVVSGEKNVGIDYTSVITGTINTNYTIEGASNLSQIYSILPLKVELEWSGDGQKTDADGVIYTFAYDGNEHVPTAVVKNLCAGDECTVTVSGAQTNVLIPAEGEEPYYIATATALSNPNYTLADVTIGSSGSTGGDGEGEGGETPAPAPVDSSMTARFVIEPAEMNLELINNTVVYGSELALAIKGNPENGAVTFKIVGKKNGGDASLDIDILTALHVGVIEIEITVEATENYEKTTAKAEVEITKLMVELEWDSPDVTYDGTHHAPTATVTNLITWGEGEEAKKDECTVTVQGAIDAGNNIVATVTALSNENYGWDDSARTTFNILPRVAEFDWTDKQQRYTGDRLNPTVTVTNKVDGDNVVAVLTEGYINMGIYTVSVVGFTGADAGNYTIDGSTTVSISDFEIKETHITVTLDQTTATYGINLPLTITCVNEDNKVMSIDPTLITYTLVTGKGDNLALIMGDVFVPQGIGTVTVRVDVGATMNSFSADAEGDIVIQKGTFEAVFNKATTVYGTDLALAVKDCPNEATVVMSSMDDSIAKVELRDDKYYLVPVKAGTVRVKVSMTGMDCYNDYDGFIEVVITKYVVELSWDNLEFTYDGTEKKPTATVVQTVNGDVITVSSVNGQTNAGRGQTATATELAGDMADSYTLEGSKTATTLFDILQRVVVFDWGNTTLSYTGEPQVPEVSVQNVCGSDAFDLKLDGAQTKVGSGYIATVTALGNENYTLEGCTNASTEFEIIKADLNLTISCDPLYYNSTAQLHLEGNLDNGDVTWSLEEDTSVAEDARGLAEFTSDDTLLGKRTGTVIVRVNVAATDSCNAGTATLVIDIKRAQMDIDLVTKEVTYSQEIKLEITGNDENGAVSYSIASDQGDCDGQADIIRRDGEYFLVGKYVHSVMVTVHVDGTRNYDPINRDIQVTIVPLVAQINWTSPLSVIFNGQPQVPTAEVDNLVPGDTCRVTVSEPHTNAGTYTVFVDATGLDNPNYAVPQSSERSTFFTIGPKPITVKLVTDRAYFQEPIRLEISGYEGDGVVTFTITDGTGSAHMEADGVTMMPDSIGTVVVTVHVAPSSDGNYLGTEAYGLIIIEKNKLPVSLKTTEAVYGEYVQLEVVFGDLPVGMATPTEIYYSVANQDGKAEIQSGFLYAKQAGTVIITVSVRAGSDSDFQDTVITVAFTIKPRPLMIEWEDFEFTYDGTTKAPTATAQRAIGDNATTGLLDGDECDIIVAGGQINAGKYNTAYAADVTNPNYTVVGIANAQAPEFEIKKAKPPLAIITTDVAWDEDLILSVTGNYGHGVVTYTVENDTGSATISGNVLHPTGPDGCGDVFVTASVTETENYLAGASSAIVNIHLPDAPVDLKNKTTPYGTDLLLEIVITKEGKPPFGAPTFEVKDGEGENAGKATLRDGNMLVPGQAGVVIVTINIPATDYYRETHLDVEVLITPLSIMLEWTYPEFIYDGEEHAPVATVVGGTLNGDVCTVEVEGCIDAGENLPAKAISLSNPNYTLEGCTNTETTFTIKPRPVVISWTTPDPEFVYDGTEQHPEATITNLIERDKNKISLEYKGWKDAGTDCEAYVIGTGCGNYTVEGGTGCDTTFTIKPKTVSLEWGEMTAVYNGKEQGPQVTIVGLIFGDECEVDYDGAGRHVGTYTATPKGLKNTNYVLDRDDYEAVTYTIVAAKLEFVWESHTAEYNGEDQEPNITPVLFAEDDEVVLTLTGGGIDVGKYDIKLAVSGAAIDTYKDYYVEDADLAGEFEITAKAITVTVSPANIRVDYTGAVIVLTDADKWYRLTTDGFVGRELGKDVLEVLPDNTLVLSPEFYQDGVKVTPQEEGAYDMKVILVSGNIGGNDNYIVTLVISEDYGRLNVGGVLALEFVEGSDYDFITEYVDGRSTYRMTYEEMNWTHGIDDTDKEHFVVGQIAPKTTINAFLANIVDTSNIKLYNIDDELVYDGGKPIDGIDTDDYDRVNSYRIGTGWYIKFADTELIYLSVLGDIDGDGLVVASDSAVINRYLMGGNNPDLSHDYFRLAAYVDNLGKISAADVSTINRYIMGTVLLSNYYNNGIELE